MRPRGYSWGFIALGVLPYVVGILLAAGSLGVSYYKGYQRGKASRDPEIVALKLDAERLRLAAAAAETRAEEAAAKVRIEYRTKIVEVEKEAETRTELVEVIRREADPNCTLPPAYRLLWNGSRSGAEDKPASRANDAPVALADAAAAAAEAKERFQRNEAQLIALQNYISQIQEAPKP